MSKIKIFILKNWKTTAWAMYSAVLVMLFNAQVIEPDMFSTLLGLGVMAGFATSADADKIKKDSIKVFVLALFACFMLSSCGSKSYRFAKFAVTTGFDIADEAGAFRKREYTINRKFTGDTLFFYEGINSYLILKKDTLYEISIVPSKSNLLDTTLHYIRKKEKEAQIK